MLMPQRLVPQRVSGNVLWDDILGPGPGDGYNFMIWAQDLDPTGDDTFRIKIWYEDGGEVVVYDNGTDQALGGGNNKVH